MSAAARTTRWWLALGVALVVSCSADPSQPVPTEPAPSQRESVATAPTTTSTTATTTTTTTTTAAEPDTDCPSVRFEDLPGGWDATLMSGDDNPSGMPQTYIARPGAIVNLFPGGSVWPPSSAASIEVDGRPGQIGTIEDGLSVRVTLLGPCKWFDFVAYGVPEDELRGVMAAVRFTD